MTVPDAIRAGCDTIGDAVGRACSQSAESTMSSTPAGVLAASREVEEVFLAYPGVSAVAVIAATDPRWIEAVAAMVVPRRECDASEADLVEHARARLAPFELPKRMLLVNDLARNLPGELRKRELRLKNGGTASAVTGTEPGSAA